VINVLLFLILTLIAEIVGTVGGFGSSVFFVSLGQFFFDFQTVLALTGLLHIFSNTAKLVLFRKSIDWKITAWLGITSIVLAIAGAYATRYIDFVYAKLLLGFFLIAFSVVFYARPSITLAPLAQMRSWEEVWPVLWQASSEPVESSEGSCLLLLTWKKISLLVLPLPLILV
jgi:hypothetical protein